jgi:hypothetical protein
MNPKLIPILQRIIARDSVLSSFDASNHQQSALAYARRHYLNDNFLWLSPEEQDLIETLPPFADNISESIRPMGGIGNSDSTVYHIFDDGSLWLKTNAYSSVWADARDYAVEIILPRMELSRMDAELLQAIGMDDAVESIRADFFHAFAETLHKQCGIPHSDARGHWNAYARQLSATEAERIELGGFESGRREGLLFAETFRTETVNA